MNKLIKTYKKIINGKTVLNFLIFSLMSRSFCKSSNLFILEDLQ